MFHSRSTDLKWKLRDLELTKNIASLIQRQTGHNIKTHTVLVVNTRASQSLYIVADDLFYLKASKHMFVLSFYHQTSIKY